MELTYEDQLEICILIQIALLEDGISMGTTEIMYHMMNQRRLSE